MRKLSLLATFFLISIINVDVSYAFNLNTPDEVKNIIVDSYENNKSDFAAKNYSSSQLAANSNLKNFYVRPSVVIPVFKIYESKKDNRKLDVSMNSGIGGGISLVRYKDATTPSKKVRVIKDDGTITEEVEVKADVSFSFSPLTVLMSKSAEEGNIDLSYASTMGFFNNTFVVGIGYDFGEVVDRSRWFGLLSIGATF
jgi:hypothetical protein